MAGGDYAYLVGYRDTTTGRHAHACRFAVMKPASVNALTLPDIRSALCGSRVHSPPFCQEMRRPSSVTEPFSRDIGNSNEVAYGGWELPDFRISFVGRAFCLAESQNRMMK